MLEEFGRALRQYRKHRRMTQTELAAEVGVAPAYVSQIESSLRIPSLRVARRIAEVLHVDLPVLLGKGAAQPVNERLSDVQKLELLRTLVRGVEQDLEGRPTHEAVESYPGARSARLASSPDVAVRTYSFRGLVPPSEMYTHNGKEKLYCACGRAWIRLDSEQHELEAGETMSFDASRPHMLFGTEGTVVVSTADPPPTEETLQRLPGAGAEDQRLPAGTPPGVQID